MSSALMTWPFSLESLSTMEAAPDTVMDSLEAPTCIVRLTRCRALTATLKVSLAIREKPTASAVTW